MEVRGGVSYSCRAGKKRRHPPPLAGGLTGWALLKSSVSPSGITVRLLNLSSRQTNAVFRQSRVLSSLRLLASRRQNPEMLACLVVPAHTESSVAEPCSTSKICTLAWRRESVPGLHSAASSRLEC